MAQVPQSNDSLSETFFFLFYLQKKSESFVDRVKLLLRFNLWPEPQHMSCFAEREGSISRRAVKKK